MEFILYWLHKEAGPGKLWKIYKSLLNRWEWNLAIDVFIDQIHFHYADLYRVVLELKYSHAVAFYVLKHSYIGSGTCMMRNIVVDWLTLSSDSLQTNPGDISFSIFEIWLTVSIALISRRIST